VESYYLSKDGSLVPLAKHGTLRGAKTWSTKYCNWGKNGASKDDDIYLQEDGDFVAMRVHGKWVCKETDSRRRATC
jgi:hypothetical protein